MSRSRPLLKVNRPDLKDQSTDRSSRVAVGYRLGNLIFNGGYTLIKRVLAVWMELEGGEQP